jgi:hypothetical protein
MTTHLLSFGFAAYEAFEDSGTRKSRFDSWLGRVRSCLPEEQVRMGRAV